MEQKATLTLLFAAAFALAACQNGPVYKYVEGRLYNPHTEEQRPIVVQPASKPDPTLDGIVKVQAKEIPAVNPTPVPQTTPTPAVKKEDYPTATFVKGKPGFVTAPYGGDKLVDVRELPPGSTAKDPYTGKPFIVPVEANPDATPEPTPKK